MELLAVVLMLLIFLLMLGFMREPADKYGENHYDVWQIREGSEKKRKKARESEKNR